MTQPLGQMARLSEALTHLAKTIDARAIQQEEDHHSWTRNLLDAGPAKCAKKLGEEGVEAALAVASEDESAVASESADLLYHLFVALRSRNVSLEDVAAALEDRQGISGVDEKAGRKD